MEDIKKTPELRFPEFSEEWEVKTLDKLFSFKNGINASKESYGKGIKFINVLDIINNNFITHNNIIGRVDVRKDIFEKNKVEYGDVLFQRSSETREEVGQSNVYLDREKSATFGGFVIRGKGISEYNPIFINFLLKTSLVRKDITKRSGGSTRYNIGQETLSAVKVHFTALEEQQKLADFLTKIDEKIEQLVNKKQLLESYKKGIIQKIFSKNFRFKDDEGKSYPDWEDKKLGDIFVERKTYEEKNKGYEHVSLTIKGVVPKTKKYERDFLVRNNEKKYKITKENDICYNPANLKFGVIARNKLGSRVFSPIYVTFEVLNENIDFVEYFVIRKDFINKVRKYEEGTVYERQAVKPIDFVKLSVLFPSFPEQTKIANFLIKIDNKINLVEKQLSKTKNYKQGLLQQMFV